MKTIHLIAGVPGSGKTHVCKQLADKYLYVAHDNFDVHDYHKELINCAKYGEQDVLAEAPFRVSILEEQLKKAGCDVVMYYLVEDLALTIKRYEDRDHKPYPAAHLTNYHKYIKRSPRFTQKQLLECLRDRK